MKGTNPLRQTMSVWKQLLEEKHALETALKARAMIYQVDEKDYVAKLFRKPNGYFHKMPYEQWKKWRRKADALKTGAESRWNNKSDITEFKRLRKLGGKVLMGQIWEAYRDYLERVGRLERFEKYIQ
jgi:hypothetical protein